MSEIIRYKPSEMADAILGLDSNSIRLQSIEVANPPNKTFYDANETFNSSGIVVEGNYSNDFKKDITSNVTYNPNVIPSLSTKKITASYTEKGITKQTDVNINSYTIVSWETGTDLEIMNMVLAADMGLIDLTDYWHVGDERKVHLSAMSATGVGETHAAQDVTLVLVDKNNSNYTYTTTPKSGRTTPFFIVQQKNGFAHGENEYGYMNSTNTNTGSWDGCARRTWCNSIYRNVLPSSIRNIFHQVQVKTAETYNGSTLKLSSDYFFLPAEREIFSYAINSNSAEYNIFTQWEYYQTGSNIIKKSGNNGNAYSWWARSPYSRNNNYFIIVLDNGTVSIDYADSNQLIAPAGCI